MLYRIFLELFLHIPSNPKNQEELDPDQIVKPNGLVLTAEGKAGILFFNLLDKNQSIQNKSKDDDDDDDEPIEGFYTKAQLAVLFEKRIDA